MPTGFGDHPCQARRQWQACQHATGRRETGIVDGAQSREQSARVVLKMPRRRLEPLERRLVTTPGEDGQQHRREIDPWMSGSRNGRSLSRSSHRRRQGPGRGAPHVRHAGQPRRRRRVRALQRVERTRGIVAGNLLQPSRSRWTHLARSATSRRCSWRGSPVGPNRARARGPARRASSEPCRGSTPRRGASRRPRLLGRARDLAGARQEAQHVAVASRQHGRRAPARRRPGRVGSIPVGCVRPAHHQRAVIQVSPHRGRIHRRRHHHDPQVVSCPPGLRHERESEIGVDRLARETRRGRRSPHHSRADRRRGSS